MWTGLTSGLIEMADRKSDSDPAKLHAYIRDRFSWNAIAGTIDRYVYRQVAAS